MTTYANPGTCTAMGANAVCDYAPTDTDCTTLDEVCSGGACVDPCVGFACDAPPPSSCNGDLLTSYPAMGICASPGGVPGCAYPPSMTDCAATSQICLGTSCQATLPIGFCRLQYPPTIVDVAGATATVFGRVYVAGLTDASGVDDLDPRLLAQVGVGTGADPAAWTWTDATANAAYGPGSPSYEANNDEYQGTLTVSGAPGATQSFAFRFSGDAGKTWTYCDTGNGSSDGFDAPGALTVAAPFFSQYVEGTSNNKALEIYNPGSIPLPLTGCVLHIYANGATTASSITLGTATVTSIASGDVYTLCHSSYALADAAQCDQKTSSLNYNGNDALELVCGTTVYDVLGQIGSNPGTEWGTGLASTADNTLLRVCTTQYGDLVGTDAFDPAGSYQGYATDFSALGSRNCPLP